MIDFFKNSIREIRHVVWPTRKETTKYFTSVMIVLVLFGLYLFILSGIFGALLTGLRNLVS